REGEGSQLHRRELGEEGQQRIAGGRDEDRVPLVAEEREQPATRLAGGGGEHELSGLEVRAEAGQVTRQRLSRPEMAQRLRRIGREGSPGEDLAEPALVEGEPALARAADREVDGSGDATLARRPPRRA